MPLVKTTFKSTLKSAYKSALLEINANIDSKKNPLDTVDEHTGLPVMGAIDEVADKLSDAIVNAVDAYLKSADVVIDGTIFSVTPASFGVPAPVAGLIPAKLS